MRAALAAFGATALFAFALLTGASAAPTPTLPSMRFLTAPLIDPTTALASYGTALAHSSSFPDSVAGQFGTPPEIVETARGLNNNPDTIFDFVHNLVGTEFAFGLRKGALGTLIDRSGTPFDQNALFVALVRQAGYTARYRIGQITLTQAQFTAWTGVSDIQAACHMLADGGVPATFNGSSSTLPNCNLAASFNSVTLLHIWSEVQINGSWYAYDPSFKSYTAAVAQPVALEAQISSGGAAQQAGANKRTDTGSGLQYVIGANESALNTYLSSAGTNLLANLRANSSSLDTAAVVGWGKIIQSYAPLGGYRNASPQGYSAAPNVTINNDIPNQYRTSLTVGLYTDGNPAFTQKLYTDEFYGRRLSIDSNFVTNGSGGLVFSLGLDDVAIVSYTCPDTTVVCQPTSRMGSSYGADPNGQVTLSVHHPYLANNGSYADQTVIRQISLSVPVAIVAGFGSISPALSAKWSGEHADDMELPFGPSAPYQCDADPTDTCQEPYNGPAGDFTRQKLAASWLAQMTRMLQLQAALGQAVGDHQHSIGVVDWRYQLNQWQEYPNPAFPINAGIQDQYTDLNIDTAVSIVSKTYSQGQAPSQTAAVSRAFAVTAATLEGSVIEQAEDLPDTASTASRFAWGNTPDNEDTCTGGASRPIYDLTSSTSSSRQALYTYDGKPIGSDCTAIPVIAGGPAPANLATQFDGVVSQYLAAGFNVTSPTEVFLGPGSPFGPPLPGNTPETNLPSHQRGGAIIATLYDGSSNVLQVAHALVNVDGVSKGGGGQQPSQFAEYDPKKAADVLKDRFVDKSVVLGVDLKTGAVGYTTPTLLSLGTGAPPLGLDFKLSYKNAPLGCTPDFGPCTNPYQGGFGHSWDIRFSLSGSGLEAMGTTSPFAATDTLVAIAALQDLYQESDRTNLEKDVDAALIADWWRQQMVGNTATLSRGFSGEQYVRLADGSWMAPIGSPGALTQTGTRVKVRDHGLASSSHLYDYSLSRRWDSVAHSPQVSFSLRKADGETLNFSPWAWKYNPDNRAEIAYGWQPTTWTFPQGPTLSFTYDYVQGVTGVTTSPFGRSMSFARDPDSGLVTASAGTTTVGQTAAGVVDAAGDVWSYGLNDVIARNATTRPIPYNQLADVYEPVNPNQPALQYAYDTLGRVEYAWDATALQWQTHGPYSFSLADAGKADRVDPLGGDYGVIFDENGDPAVVVDEDHRIYAAAFDGRHRVASRTYPEGDQDVFGYDASDNVTSLTKIAKPGSGLANLNITATYNAAWNKLASITDAMGNTTNLTYGASGAGASLLTRAQRPPVGGMRPTFTYAYDLNGELTQEVDPTGVATTHAYDGSGNLISTTLGAAAVGSSPALNLTTTYTPDSIGNVVAVQDPLGNLVSTQYDAMRRKTAEQSHQGGASGLNLAAKIWTYDANGRELSEQRATGFQSAAPYYATGWQVWSTAYTPTGKAASTTDPLGAVTLTHYDGLDRVFQVIDPDALVSETDYDGAGQVLAEMRGVGTPLAQTYAAYTWSGDGNKLSVSDANANTVTLGYDGFNRPASTTFADGTAETAAYDPDGELTLWTNRGGASVVRCYDSLGRKVSERGATGAANAGACPTGGRANTAARSWDISNASFGYDLAGRMTSASNATWSEGWAYDAAGRLASLSDAFGTLSDSYDAGSNLTGQVYGNGFQAGWSYDGLHRVTGASFQRPTDTHPFSAATLAYDALSRRTSVVFGDTSSQTYGYDGADRVTSIAHDFPGATSGDVTYGYGYDAAGRDVSRTISNPSYRFSPAAGSTTYAAANALNQYPGVGGQAYGYYPEGPLSQDGSLTHYYDELNAQVSAVGPGGSSLSWSRDALGAQAYGGKVSATATTSTAYGHDGSRPEAIIERVAVTPAGASQPTISGDREFVLGPEPDERLAFIATTGLVFYPHVDRQGSTIALSASRMAQSQWSYGPYGETPDAVSAGAGASSYGYRYTGQRYDSDFALYDDKARTYSPALGRFLQPDPAGLDQGPNLYGYTHNDPVNGSDPLGTETYQVGLSFTFLDQSFEWGGYRDQNVGDPVTFRYPIEEGNYRTSGHGFGLQIDFSLNLTHCGQCNASDLQGPGRGVQASFGPITLGGGQTSGKSTTTVGFGFGLGLRPGVDTHTALSPTTGARAGRGPLPSLSVAASRKGYDSVRINKDGSITASRSVPGSHIPQICHSSTPGSCS